MARTNRRMAQWTIELLDVQLRDSVLGVGFGPGVGIELVASFAPSEWSAGVDPSEEMVEQAQPRTRLED